MINTLLTYTTTKSSTRLDDLVALIDKWELVSADITLDECATLSVNRYWTTFEEWFNFTLISNDEFFDISTDILFWISSDKIIWIIHEFVTDYVWFMERNAIKN